MSAQNKQRWSECLNLDDIHCGTFGDCICGTNCCLMNSGGNKKQMRSCFLWLFAGEKKALHLLKGRQYSIMCQNRIRGLLKLQPCQREDALFCLRCKSFLLVSIFLHYYLQCVCVYAHVCAIFSGLLFDVS